LHQNFVWNDVAQQPAQKESIHRFFDRTIFTLQAVNATLQTMALLAIQAQDRGGEMAPCTISSCDGALESHGANVASKKLLGQSG